MRPTETTACRAWNVGHLRRYVQGAYGKRPRAGDSAPATSGSPKDSAQATGCGASGCGRGLELLSCGQTQPNDSLDAASAEARVDEAVARVDYGVEHHKGDRDDKHGASDNGIVLA